MMGMVARVAVFDRVWAGLAQQGACEGSDSAEHVRVRNEWLAAGRPSDVAAFIRQRASLPLPAQATPPSEG